MSTDDFEERLREVSAAVLGVDVDALSDTASPSTLREWTSVAHLSLISAIEEALSIHFSVDEIFAAQSFGALREIVSRHRTIR
jgi:acyl carrier protein